MTKEEEALWDKTCDTVFAFLSKPEVQKAVHRMLTPPAIKWFSFDDDKKELSQPR